MRFQGTFFSTYKARYFKVCGAIFNYTMTGFNFQAILFGALCHMYGGGSYNYSDLRPDTSGRLILVGDESSGVAARIRGKDRCAYVFRIYMTSSRRFSVIVSYCFMPGQVV